MLAFCASLVAHGLLGWWLMEDYNALLGASSRLPIAAKQDTRDLIVPAPPPFPDLYPNLMGEATGVGDASASTPGDQPLEARASDQTQPITRQDPSADSGQQSHKPGSPAQSTLDTFSPAEPNPVNVAPPASSDSKPFGVASATPDLLSPTLPKTPRVKQEIAADAYDPPDELDQKDGPTTTVMRAPESTPRAPRPSEQAAPESTTGAPSELASKSDSESDPFKKNGVFNLRNGKVDARFGRKVKIVRPHFSLAGLWDQDTPGSAVAILAIAINAEGTVTKVEILKSSGSNEIDLPIQRAMYRWWIEPLKDGNGKPIPDVTIWTIQVR